MICPCVFLPACLRVCLVCDVPQTFFAVARGFDPVHELCGAMTALALSRRDILGHKVGIPINLPAYLPTNHSQYINCQLVV